jgi:hypothetical protein
VQFFKEFNMKKFNMFVFMLIMGVLFGSSADAQISPKIYASDTFIVEEYPMTRKDLYDNTLVHMKKREKWRTPAPDLETLNKRFSPLGYRFVQVSPGNDRDFANPRLFDFYQGDQLLIGGISNIRGVSLDQDGKHFVFIATKWGKQFAEDAIVCIDGKIQRCPTKEKSDGWKQLGGPAYVKNKLVWCEVTYAGDMTREVNLSHWEGRVRNAMKVLFEFSFEYGAGSMPVHFREIGGTWLLEVDDGRVILNGVDLCKKYNYSGMWLYRSLKGKPIFFFTYTGEVGGQSYIIHFT